jgi:hypothetical protein
VGVRLRLVVLVTSALAPSLLAISPTTATAGTNTTATTASDAETQLAQRYAPVVRLVEQKDPPCGDGEAFQPTDVNAVLNNPEVSLRGPWSGANLVKVGPTAQDLSAGLFGYHLDFPGNALNPGCMYDQWEQRISGAEPPTVYAHVVTEPSHPGQLALQYWFFYIYNDFNDKHEGDWEMVQLNFAAASAEEALAKNPTETGYSQHEGAERAKWGDDKLQLVDGTHPVVYPALGSHANYYNSHLYLGRSASQGVGCDDTIGPSRELHPEVSVIPQDREAYLASYPWLGYIGRWGEEHSGFYNGPTGPNTKDRWTTPFTWEKDSWRDQSFSIPAQSSSGHSATHFFCAAVAAGSNLLTALLNNPTPVLLVIVAIIAIVVWLARRTRWQPSTPLRVRRRRAWGTLVTAAFRMFVQHPRMFLGIGLLFIPIGVLTGAVQYDLFRIGGLHALFDELGSHNAIVAFLALGLGVVLTIFGLVIVQAATAVAVVALDEGRQITARAAYRQVIPRLPRLLLSLFFAALVVILLGLTVFGAVVGAVLIVFWSMLAYVVMLEASPSRRPLLRSARLVRHHWWRTASVTAFVTGVALLLGPLAGTILLFITSASFNIVNLVSAVIYVATLPFAAITTTYLYFDLDLREHLEATSAPDVLPAEG